MAALVDLAVDSFGQLDVMFNNAGIVGARGPIDQTPDAEWRFTIDVLLGGVFYGMKHAVVGLTKNVGAELCRFGIRVNGHCLTTGAGVTTGSKADSAPYSEPLPIMREAVKVGL